MEMSGLTLELARLTGTSETRPCTWLDEFGEDPVNELFSLLDTIQLDIYKQGNSKKIWSYLDTIELDENLQFLRLSEDYPARPCWKIIKFCCKLASLSQSFYRRISEEQWLRTIIQLKKQKPVIEFHSNVVPRQVYLMRLQGLQATCPDQHQCTGGFFPTSVGEPPRQSCTDCALAKQLRGGAHMSAEVGEFLFVTETDVSSVDNHDCLGRGSEGEVKKILWLKGIFARKRFNCEGGQRNGNLDRELDVVLSVAHPNIVHCFGCSSWTPDSADSTDYCDLFMELLEGDLEKLLLEGARTGDLLPFRDLLDVLLQITEAMQHLHEKNFLHGDLKPGNILVSKLTMPHSDVQFYLIKVADFGCAQRVDSSVPFSSGVGTLCYTAPEVLRCRRKYGGEAVPKDPQKMDVYSFGVVAFQVLTGATNLYEDCRESRIGERVIKGLRPDFGFSETLDDDRLSLLTYIQSCWSQNPEERPSFSQICDELKRRSIEHGLQDKNAKHKRRRISEVNVEQQRFQRPMLSLI